MATGLDLGAAFFNFALNAEGMVKGMSQAGAAVAGGVGKIAPGVGKLGESFSAADNKISGVMRSTERFSRGLRGISPEVQRSTENLYAMQDASARLGRSIERQKLLIAEKEQAERRNLDTIQRITQEEEKRRLGVENLRGALDGEREILENMRNSQLRDAEAIEKTTAAYNKTGTEIDQVRARGERLRAELALQQAAVAQRAEVEERLGIRLKAVQADYETNITQQELSRQTINRLNVEYQGFETRLNETLAIYQREMAEADRKHAMMVREENDLKDLRMEKMRFGAQETEAQAAIDRSIVKQNQYSLALHNAKDRLKDMEAANADANDKRNFTIEQLAAAQFKIDELSLAYEKQGFATRNLRLEYAELQIEHSRVANTEAILTTRIGELAAEENEMRAAAERRLAVMREQQAKYEQLPAAIAREEAKLNELTIAEEQHAAVIRKTLQEQEQIPLQYAREDAAIQEKDAAIKNLEANEEKLVLRQAEEYRTMVQAQNQRGPSNEAMKQQAELVNQTERALRKEEEALDISTRKKAEATQRQERLNTETQNSKLTLQDLVSSQNKASVAIDLAKQKLQEKIEKIKANRETEQQAKAVTDQAAKSEQAEARAAEQAARSAGLFGAATQRAIPVQQAFNETVNKTGSILRDIVVGSIGSFIGNTLANLTSGLGGLVQTGLDAYKSNELLGMSLTALSAREIGARKGITDLSQVQGEASIKSKELIGWMQQLAIQSPFSVEDISGAFRLGNALGFTASQTQLLTKDTVDWAAATGASGEGITSVIRALGQMHNTGHVSLEDLNQLTDAGLGARDILRKEFAPEILKSKTSLEDMISAGLIPADRAINAVSRSLEKDFPDGAKKSGDSMEGLINSIGDLKNTALREFFTSTFQAVQPLISSVVSVLTDPSTTASIRAFGNLLGSGIGNALNWLGQVAVPTAIQAFQTFGPMVLDAIAALGAVAQEAYNWGYNIGQQFSAGLNDTLDAIMSVVSWIGNTLTEWLAPGSPPKILPDIDTWGKETMQVYFDAFKTADSNTPIGVLTDRISESFASYDMGKIGSQSAAKYFAGWGDADFSTFDSIKKNVGDLLSQLAESGKLDEKAVIPTMLGTGDAIKQALDDIRTTGKVSDETFKRIHDTAGQAGQGVEQYIQSMLKSVAANEAVQKAQEALNTVTAQYDGELDALHQQQQRLQDQSKAHEEDKQLAVLRAQLAAKNPAGMGNDKTKIQNEIDQILLQRKIDATEREKAAAVNSAQAKLDAAKKAAEAAQAELDFQQHLIDNQKEQNELIKKQIELMEGKTKKSIKDQAEEDRKAKEEYEFNKASTADQLKMLIEKQKHVREGSAEWYQLQAQIDAKREEANKKVAQAEARGDKAEEKTKKAEEQQHEAEYKARLAAAQTEEERLQIMQEEQARYAVGSTEYLKLQADIEKQKDRVSKASEKQAAAQHKVSEAEFEANLAGKPRAEQIQMLKDHLGELTEGSLEYEKVRKRINTLEAQEAKGAGGGGRKGKGKGGPLGGGDPLRELHAMTEAGGKAADAVGKIGTAFGGIGERITAFRQMLAPFFNFLNQSGGAIGFVLQKLAVSFAVALAIEKVLKPLGSFIFGLRQFITWGNAFWVLLTLIGFAWKSNFGGIRDVAAEVWAAIQAPLKNIIKLAQDVSAAFGKDGFGAALNTLLAGLPGLGADLVNIGVVIFKGIKKWIGPFIENFIGFIGDVVQWVKDGGLLRIGEELKKGFDTLLNMITSEGFFSSGSIAAGALGLVGGISMLLQSALAGLAVLLGGTEGGGGFIQQFGQWLQEKIPVAVEYLSVGLGVAIAALGEGLVPALVFLIKRIIDIAAWFLPMLPDLLSGLMSGISVLLGWLLARGVPLLLSGIIQLATYLFNKLAEVLPGFGLKLGLFLGSTVTKLLGALLTGVISIIYTLFFTDFYKKILGLGVSIINGLGGILKGIAGFVVGILLGLLQPIVSVGKQLIAGLGEGFLGGVGSFLASIGSFFDQAIAWIKGLLGIASPSTVFAAIGQALIDGLIAGLAGIIDILHIFSDFGLAAIDIFINFVTTAVQKFLDMGVRLVATVTDFTAQVFSLFGVSRDDLIGIITDLYTSVTTTWANLKTDVMNIAGILWTGLVGTAGWITKLFNDTSQFFTDLWNAITGNGGSFTQLKADIIQLALDVWDGLVGSAGWITKLYNAGLQLFTDLKDGITGPSGLFTILKNDLATLGQDIWEGMVGTTGFLTKLVTDFPAKVIQFIEVARAVLQSFALWISDAVNGLAADMIQGGEDLGHHLLHAMTEFISQHINQLTDWVSDHLHHFIDNLINSVTGQGSGGSGPPPPSLASGTRNARGGLTLVGEHGPELVMLPRAAQVFSSLDTRLMMGRMVDQVAGRMVNRLSTALAKSAMQMGSTRPVTQTIIKDHRVKEDHYHLTVNTAATVGTYIQDIGIMKATRHV